MASSEGHPVDNDNLVDNDFEEDLFDDIAEQHIQSSNELKVVDRSDVLDRESRKRTAPVYVPYDEFPHKRFKQNIEIQDVVMDHALYFLPAKSLCRFKTVSKEWDKLINKPFFAHQQTHSFRDISGLFCQLPGDKPSFISLDRNAYGIPSPSLRFLPQPVTIRTACKGLLCCQNSFEQNRYYICNPVNEEWKVLPEPILYHGPDQSALALAFEPSALNFAAHFELVCAVSLCLTDEPVIRFEIYSSRSSSWRLAETMCSEVDALKLTGDGIFLKGVVFWETFAGAILAFDLKEEHYGILSLPPNSGLKGVLTEMRGELCYILPVREGNDYTLEIYGDLDMNLKHIVLLDLGFLSRAQLGFVSRAHRGLLRVLACVKDDTVIILVEDRVIAYNMKSWTVQTLRHNVIGAYSADYNAGFAKYLPYVNSLVHVRSSYLTSLLSEDPSSSYSYLESL
ncbi:PREDICTED: F-box protein At5g07610-like [Fragaria vesca subsp. vesca]|uniref:F-box protein At5g07610-like n=1 Tax=Fragaria vesca subsp. vesca TaxID=101020 RepID=UPI0002C35FF3|nr:PREDICTED: F-box protein At5g07610-like [Fragaria vesca subsp. vesca]XP_011462975.1 PREDICTED: F-box protein At5g07610-like [Fragaria vesca subsp. vesca]